MPKPLLAPIRPDEVAVPPHEPGADAKIAVGTRRYTLVACIFEDGRLITGDHAAAYTTVVEHFGVPDHDLVERANRRWQTHQQHGEVYLLTDLFYIAGGSLVAGHIRTYEVAE